jgi:hypothetical protein
MKLILKINKKNKIKEMIEKEIGYLIKDLKEELKKKYINNLDNKNYKELNKLKKKIANFIDSIQNNNIRYELRKTILEEVEMELCYKKWQCQKKGIDKSEFKIFWQEYNSSDAPSPEFLFLYRKIFNEDFYDKD